MSHKYSLSRIEQQLGCSRRQFLGGALAAAASGPLLGGSAALAADQPAAEAKPGSAKRKIKLGWVGCGGRGGWIAGSFRDHGGYEIYAVADYFQTAADQFGETWGADKSRRFSGLSGYKKVIESGVEAIVLQTPPYFFAEHACAAVEAGLHVYMAKPVAADVPSCLRIEAAGKQATQKQRVLFVDYQLPTDPVNIQVAERIRKGELGKFAKVSTVGVFGGNEDPPKTATVESRLRNGVWDNDIAIGGGWSVAYDIHAIDAAMWILGRRPVAASGASRICRINPHGDSTDVTAVVYEYADGLIHEHSGQALPNAITGELSCRVAGQKGFGVVAYDRKARLHVRGQEPYAAEVVGLYGAGAIRNIATFYEDVLAGRCENLTVPRAVDGNLTCILGREAAARRCRLTMEELIKENKRLELDLTGLKV